jgi:DNA-binding NarL/FixJ family response regulator
MKHLHVVSSDDLRREAVRKRLAPFAQSLQTYKSSDLAASVLYTLDSSRAHLVIYVPPPKNLEEYSHELISLYSLKSLGFPIALICMSTEEALIQIADVLKLNKIFYDAQVSLAGQIQSISNGRGIPKHIVKSRAKALTPRERSVLIGLQAGLTLKEIAANLGISPNTASTYKMRIMQKLGYRNNAELLQGQD